MITSQQAVQAARAYVGGLYEPEELRHLRLEELEQSDDAQHWEVTLGWDDVAVAPGSGLLTSTLQVYRIPRVYKRVVVNAQTGDVKALRIRDVG